MSAPARHPDGAPWHLDTLLRSVEVVLKDGSRQSWTYADTGGSGRGLVMLPGSVGTCEMFFKQVQRLGRDMRILAVTYPAEADAKKLADGLALLLDRIGLAEPDVLGSSFAAYWLQAFALRHPRRFRTLILGNGFAEPSTLFTLPLFDPAFVRSTPAADLQESWRARVAAGPDSELRSVQLDMLSGRQSAEALKSRFLGVIAAKLLPRPEEDVEARMVILETEDDPLISAEARRVLREHLPAARVVTLKAGGHYPHILTADAYEAALRGILD